MNLVHSISSNFQQLADESRDFVAFSEYKKIAVVKDEQIHKNTTIFTQNDNFEFILFSASDKSRDSSANSSKLEQMEWSWSNHRSSYV